MRRVMIGFVLTLFVAASAQAVTLKDIVDLTRAGLGEEVLIALIEVDGGVFDVDSATLAGLKASGVSDKVIVALVRSGRVRPAEPEPQTLTNVVAEQQAPEVVYVQQPASTVVREVAVPYPVYVAVPVSVRRHGNGDHGRAPVVPTGIVAPTVHQEMPHFLTDVPPPPKQQEPVYWGSGGKLRPDAWKPK